MTRRKSLSKITAAGPCGCRRDQQTAHEEKGQRRKIALHFMPVLIEIGAGIERGRATRPLLRAKPL
jgi:hypothetical protein